ncbi:HMCN1-like protein, partial [Mya arenaria]
MFIVGSIDALECYNCPSISNTHDCNTTAVCAVGQSCFLKTFENGGGSFSLGCISNEVCVNIKTFETLQAQVRATNVHQHTSVARQSLDGLPYRRKLGTHPFATNAVLETYAMLTSANINYVKLAHNKRFPKKQCSTTRLSGQQLEAVVYILVDGHWSDWSVWSGCDVTCGNGEHSRDRTCTYPAPAHGGLDCTGLNADRKTCNNNPCPNGGWSDWESWSACPVTCDVGLRSRQRFCNNPFPSMLGQYCQGKSDDYIVCNTKPCK